MQDLTRRTRRIAPRSAPSTAPPAPFLRLSRRRLIAGGMALAATPLLPRFLAPAGAAARAFGFPPADMTSRIVRPIEFPVRGPVSWTDTYGACRDGCTRHHEGQDLIAQKLQKLVACVDGTIVGLKYDPSGNYLYLQDADGWNYGYLHINNDTPGTDDGLNPRAWAFAPGIAVGVHVSKGQHIAYLGDSGNAETTVPHCHFEIRKPADAWYHGQAINAKYSLDAASHGSSGVPVSTFVPWTTASAFVGQQYMDFLNRQPTSKESTDWSGRLDRGEQSPADLVEWIIQQPASSEAIAPLIRLYWACFNRMPDTPGMMYWIVRVRGGASLGSVANTFATTGEFDRRFGSLNDAAYVDRVYRDILGRAADPGGRSYWVGRLGSGTSRGEMIRFFAESDYFHYVTFLSVRIALVYAGMLRRAPDPAGFMYWLDQMGNHGTTLQTMITLIQKSASYRTRFS